MKGVIQIQSSAYDNSSILINTAFWELIIRERVFIRNKLHIWFSKVEIPTGTQIGFIYYLDEELDMGIRGLPVTDFRCTSLISKFFDF